MLSDPSVPVLFLPQIERRFAPFHDPLDRVPHVINVDRAFSGATALQLLKSLCNRLRISALPERVAGLLLEI